MSLESHSQASLPPAKTPPLPKSQTAPPEASLRLLYKPNKGFPASRRSLQKVGQSFDAAEMGIPVLGTHTHTGHAAGGPELPGTDLPCGCPMPWPVHLVALEGLSPAKRPQL